MRVRLLLVPLIAAAALLVGCTSTPATNGVEKLESAQILQKATDALTAAKSFRVQGTSKTEGQTGDYDVTYVGQAAEGTITFEGASIELIKVADGTYVKATDSFWKTVITDEKHQAAALAIVAGKYVKLPNDTAAAVIQQGSSFLRQGQGEWAKGDVRTVDGRQAITLKATDGELHICLVGEPYPIDVVGTDGSSLKFLDIDKGVTVQAPADALDLTAILNQLTAG